MGNMGNRSTSDFTLEIMEIESEMTFVRPNASDNPLFLE